MYALIGRVEIHSGYEEETAKRVQDSGIGMVQAMAGSISAYWARGGLDNIQHSFWLFDTEEHAQVAHAAFSRLREMPDAPATLLDVEVCEVIGELRPA